MDVWSDTEQRHKRQERRIIDVSLQRLARLGKRECDGRIASEAEGEGQRTSRLGDQPGSARLQRLPGGLEVPLLF